MSNKIIILAGTEHNCTRFRLGNFLRLQSIQAEIDDAVKSDDTGKIAQGIFDYLKLCIPEFEFKTFCVLSWHEIIIAYASLGLLNQIENPERFAILQHSIQRDRESWHYPQRAYFSFVHSLAYAYKWPQEHIENLTPEEGIAFMQEIVSQQQSERAFTHMLSSVAYGYDAATKKQTYRPYELPNWMKVGREEQRKTIAKERLVDSSLLPQGKVVRASENT